MKYQYKVLVPETTLMGRAKLREYGMDPCVVFAPTDLQETLRRGLGDTKYRILLQILAEREHKAGEVFDLVFPPKDQARWSRSYLIAVADSVVDGQRKRAVYEVTRVSDFRWTKFAVELIGRLLIGSMLLK